MGQVKWGSNKGLIALTLLLLGMAFYLIAMQVAVRTVFIAHDNAVAQGKRLKEEQADLLMKIRRASLPGEIAQGAQALGLSVAKDDDTVSLVVKTPTSDANPKESDDAQ